MNPVIVEQNRMRRALDTAARLKDNDSGGVRIFGVTAQALMAEEAPRFARLAAQVRMENQWGIVTEYGDNTPAQIIHGFHPEP